MARWSVSAIICPVPAPRPAAPAGSADRRPRTINTRATIERERFRGNDRPGVILASALRTYVDRFATAPGRNRSPSSITFADDGLGTTAQDVAKSLRYPDAPLIRAKASPNSLTRPLARAACVILTDAVVTAASTGPGRQANQCPQGNEETPDFRKAAVRAAVPGGYESAGGGLTTHLGGKPAGPTTHSAFLPGELPPGMQRQLARPLATLALRSCLRTGLQAGASGGGRSRLDAPAARRIPQADDEPSQVSALWHIEGVRGKAFVDLQNDVTAKDVSIAKREGFRAVEHLKRYTTLGMATDQGKTANVNGQALMAYMTGRPMSEAGTTRFRPPHVPVAIGAFAGAHVGRHFKATRYCAGHSWAPENGATMVEAGQWLRPRWFTQPGETDWFDSVTREVKTVRAAGGICDVSSLGKIDIQGRDAGVFLDRVYVNMFSTLPVGKARYGLMLREDGFVLDDGTTARLGPNNYVMSTTTANAGKVMQHLEFCHQVLWPELDVAMVSVTEQWAQYAVAGPKSREVLQNLLGTRFDVSNEAFPFLACAEFSWGDVTVRLYRISFSGELAYEIAAPADYGDSLMRALMRAAAPLGVVPYGSEALGVLRIEKGHVSVPELNGQTTAGDIGLGKMLSKKKDFIGRVLAERPALTDPERPALVGLKPVDPGERLRAGAHSLALDAAATAQNDAGYMTSVAYSPHVGSWIGLGLLKRGATRIGEYVRAYDPVRNGDVEVEVVSPVFVDPEGKWLHE